MPDECKTILQMVVFELDDEGCCMNLIYVLFLSLLVVSGLEDKYKRRIDNRLSMLLVLIGIINLLSFNVEDLNLKLIIAIIIGLLALYAMGAVGGGDFKVFIASSLIIQPQYLIFSIIITMLLGSILMLCKVEKNPPLVTIFALTVIPYFLAIFA